MRDIDPQCVSRARQAHPEPASDVSLQRRRGISTICGAGNIHECGDSDAHRPVRLHPSLSLEGPERERSSERCVGRQIHHPIVKHRMRTQELAARVPVARARP
jgi:hypothetical protein